MNFNEQREQKVMEIERVLQRYLPMEEGYQKRIMEAMEYNLMAGGKRLRPMMMQETYKMFGGNSKIIEPFMAALEMIYHLWTMMSIAVVEKLRILFMVKGWRFSQEMLF